MSTYEGYSNHSTFTVDVECDNIRPLYDAKLELFAAITQQLRTVAPDDVRKFVKAHLPTRDKPSVNYDELAEGWEIERVEMLAYANEHGDEDPFPPTVAPLYDILTNINPD